MAQWWIKKIGMLLGCWYLVTIFIMGNIACYYSYQVVWGGAEFGYTPPANIEAITAKKHLSRER